MRYLKGTMDYGLSLMEIMTSHCVDTLMQIGQEALLTEKALPDVVSVWDQLLSRGRVGSNPVLLSAQRKQSTLPHVLLAAKLYGFESC
jgi:hypothetical protein